MDIYSKWLVKQPIAHRGLHNDELPENSLGAFENAVLHNFAIELDVRPLDDGKIVVFHDEKLGRVTGADGYIGKLTSETVKGIRLGGTEYGIPSFAEVLELVNRRTPILVEIKNIDKVGLFERKLLDMLKEYRGEFAVQAFNPYSIDFFRANAPNILRGQLASSFKGVQMSALRKFVLRRMMFNKTTKPDFISYCFEDLPTRFVSRYNLPVLGWTVRSESDEERARVNCDNIIFECFVPKNN
jgi:glycerophosphoryl diester phosphodiesterase